MLSFADYVELVHDFLIDEAEWLPSKELKCFHVLLHWDVLGDHKLGDIHFVWCEEVWLREFLPLTNLEEGLKLASRVDLAIPQLQSCQHVLEVTICELLLATVAHAEAELMHLAVDVGASHRQILLLKQLHLVRFDDCFGDTARPLVLQTDLPLLVAKVLVAAKDLNSLLANISEAFLDHLQTVRVELCKLIPLNFRLLVAVLAVPLQQKFQFVNTDVALNFH